MAGSPALAAAARGGGVVRSWWMDERFACLACRLWTMRSSGCSGCPSTPRRRRSESPATGALNASAGLVVLFSAAGHELNPILAGPLGVAPWLAVAVIVAVLGAFRQFEVSRLGSVTNPSAEVEERAH